MKVAKKQVTRTVVIDSHVADNAVALSRVDVNKLGTEIAAPVQLEKAADLFIDATNVDANGKAKAKTATVGEA